MVCCSLIPSGCREFGMAKKRKTGQLNMDGRMMFYLVLMLLAACLLIFHSFVFGNDVMVFGEAGSDTRQQYLMWYNSIVNHIRAGRFSLWDATNGFGGTMYNYYLFQPLLVIVYAIGVLFGPQVIPHLMVYVVMANILLSGIFCYLLLCVWDMDERAKLTTAFLYAFNGYLVVWGQHYGLGAACVWLPLLLMMTELSLRNKKMYPWVAFGSAITILSGYYQGYLILLGMAIYGTRRILVYAGGSLKERLTAYVLTGFSLFSGLLMGAVNLLPSAKSLQVTSRLGSGESLLHRFVRNLAPYEREYYRTLVYRLLGNNLQGSGVDYLGDANYYEAINLCMGALLIILGVQFLPLFFKKHRQLRERIAVLLGMLISLFLILVKAG